MPADPQAECTPADKPAAIETPQSAAPPAKHTPTDKSTTNGTQQSAVPSAECTQPEKPATEAHQPAVPAAEHTPTDKHNSPVCDKSKKDPSAQATEQKEIMPCEEIHDVLYFRNLVKSETAHLTGISERWSKINDETPGLSEDGKSTAVISWRLILFCLYVCAYKIAL